VVNVTPGPLYPRESGHYQLCRRLCGPQGTGAENLAPTRIRFPDRPFLSESLYRLSYLGPIRFHGTRVHVIPCVPVINTVFPQPICTQRVHYVEISHAEFHRNGSVNVESADRNLFTPRSKVPLLLHRFSRNLSSSNTFLLTCSALNFIRVGRKVQKMLGALYLHYEVKCGVQCIETADA
jgi:hypothetical protein